MAEPSITDIFGAGATQDSTTILISKADLDIVASANNKAEGLLAAIFKKAGINLTQTAFNADEARSIYISPSFDSIASRTVNNTTTQLYQTAWNIVFAKPQTTPGITPNDY